MQDISVAGHSIHKVNDEYFYLLPSSLTTTSVVPLLPISPLVTKTGRRSVGRCITPSPISSHNKMTHRRSVSWSAAISSNVQQSSRSSVSSNVGSVAGTVDYDASRSNSTTSSVTLPLTPLLPEDIFWLVLRVLPSTLELYLQSRWENNYNNFY